MPTSTNDPSRSRPGPTSSNIATNETERNGLLRALPRQAHAALAPYLETVDLRYHQGLGTPHEDVPFVYFPLSGVISITKTMRDGRKVGVGSVGCEGMTALAVFLGGEEMPTECIVQIPGEGKRIDARQLQRLSREGTSLHGILLRYTQYLFSQVGQTVACSKLHSIEQQLVRWLLMTSDRVGGDSFTMTHENLAAILGVRRASVSTVAETLKRANIIRYVRGKVEILDREKLEARSCECYTTTRTDFERLLGQGAEPQSDMWTAMLLHPRAASG